MPLHSDTLSWFRANQYLLLLLSAVILAGEEAPHTNSIVFEIRSRKSKDRQHNGRKKKDKGTNNDVQTSHKRIEQYEVY